MKNIRPNMCGYVFKIYFLLMFFAGIMPVHAVDQQAGINPGTIYDKGKDAFSKPFPLIPKSADKAVREGAIDAINTIQRLNENNQSTDEAHPATTDTSKQSQANSSAPNNLNMQTSDVAHTWDSAVQYCTKSGGHLPTTQDLKSIPYDCNGNGRKCGKWFWSSEEIGSAKTVAKVVNIQSKNENSAYKRELYGTICVNVSEVKNVKQTTPISAHINNKTDLANTETRVCDKTGKCSVVQGLRFAYKGNSGQWNNDKFVIYQSNGKLILLGENGEHPTQLSRIDFLQTRGTLIDIRVCTWDNSCEELVYDHTAYFRGGIALNFIGKMQIGGMTAEFSLNPASTKSIEFATSMSR